MFRLLSLQVPSRSVITVRRVRITTVMPILRLVAHAATLGPELVDVVFTVDTASKCCQADHGAGGSIRADHSAGTLTIFGSGRGRH